MTGDANEGFIRWKSRHAATWALVNLLRIADYPCATALGAPLAGRHVFVAGAGASLEHALPVLRNHDDPILAVNKSAVVLRKHGIDPYAVVVRESIDVSSHLEGNTSLVCADISAHPRVWDAATPDGGGELGRFAWFVPATDQHFTLAQILGVLPTFGGTSAFTTAVHLARVWGAASITLVGADLCLTDLGAGEFHAYHRDAPRSSLRATVFREQLHVTGGEDDDDLCLASGQIPQPRVINFHRLPAWDFGGVRPVHDALLDEHAWLVTEARRQGRRLRLRNASRGVGIPGWRAADVSPGPGLRAEPPCALHRVSRERRDSMHAWLRAQAQDLLTLSEEMAHERGPSLDRLRQLPLWRGAPLVEVLAASRQIDGPADPNARCVHHYQAFAAAAREVLEILEQAS